MTITCKHCGEPVEQCTRRPPHGGCSSAFGYIHVGGAHGCMPRSDGPYAEPSDASVRTALESVTIDPQSPASQASIDALMVARAKTRRRS